MHDSRENEPATRNEAQPGEPSADANNKNPASLAEEYSQTAFGRGMDAAGVGLALRALEGQDQARSAEGEMSFVRREMERRAAKAQALDEGKGPGRG